MKSLLSRGAAGSAHFACDAADSRIRRARCGFSPPAPCAAPTRGAAHHREARGSVSASVRNRQSPGRRQRRRELAARAPPDGYTAHRDADARHQSKLIGRRYDAIRDFSAVQGDGLTVLPLISRRCGVDAREFLAFGNPAKRSLPSRAWQREPSLRELSGRGRAQIGRHYRAEPFVKEWLRVKCRFVHKSLPTPHREGKRKTLASTGAKRSSRRPNSDDRRGGVPFYS